MNKDTVFYLVVEGVPTVADDLSPLRGITKWGDNMARALAEGVYAEHGRAHSAAMALAAALTDVQALSEELRNRCWYRRLWRRIRRR